MLDIQAKEKLVRRLLACRSFKGRQSRDKVIDELSFGSHIERSNTDFDDTMNIVNSTLYYMDGFDELLQTLEVFEGKSSSMTQMQNMIAELKPTLNNEQSISHNKSHPSSIPISKPADNQLNQMPVATQPHQKKFALLISNDTYDDTRLSKLQAPQVDVESLSDVLLNPLIGAFDDVKILSNQKMAPLRSAILSLFADKKPDDLLLLYFSGHGLLDSDDSLCLATYDTDIMHPSACSIDADFIVKEMNRSRSTKQLLILDSCHSGAFRGNVKGVLGTSVDTESRFKGKGRIVLAASDMLQLAFEDGQLVEGEIHSVFTHYLVQGLQTGEAALDGNRFIYVNDLYEYVHERVIAQEPRQTPMMWSYGRQGSVRLAYNIKTRLIDVEDIYEWPTPWSNENREMSMIENSLKHFLTFNPFAILEPELDPILQQCYIPLTSTKDISYRNMNILCCPTGSGKTTAALNLYHQCIAPLSNPTIRNIFPVYWNISAPVEIGNGQGSILRLITNQICKSLVEFLARNPKTYLECPSIQKRVIKTLLLSCFNSIKGLRDNLALAGLDSGNTVQRFISDLAETDVVDHPKWDSLTTWLRQIKQAHLAAFDAFYLIIDVSDENMDDHGHNGIVALISFIITHSTDLILSDVYPKLFISDKIEKSLNLPAHIKPSVIEWSSEQLKQLLRNRLQQAGEDTGNLNWIFEIEEEELNIEAEILNACKKSPRRLMDLMDQLIRLPNTCDKIELQKILDVLKQN